MTRIKLIKNYKDWSKGDSAEVTPNVAHGLIDSGYAILSKDMTSNEVTTRGGSTKLRTNKPSGRKGKSRN